MPGKEQRLRGSARYEPSELSTCFFPELDGLIDKYIKRRSPVVENVLEMAFRSQFSRARGYESVTVGPQALPGCRAKKSTLDDYRTRLIAEIRSLGEASDPDLQIRVIDSRVAKGRAEFVYLLDLRSERAGGLYGLFTNPENGGVQILCNKSVVLTGAKYSVGKSGEFEFEYFPYLSFEAFSYCTKRLKMSKTLERDQEKEALYGNPLIPSIESALTQGLRLAGHTKEIDRVIEEMEMRSSYKRSPIAIGSQDEGSAYLKFSGSRVEASIQVSLDPVTRQIRAELLEDPHIMDID